MLANVASLMIFDDHEVTDDWNIDHDWVSTPSTTIPRSARCHQRDCSPTSCASTGAIVPAEFTGGHDRRAPAIHGRGRGPPPPPGVKPGRLPCSTPARGPDRQAARAPPPAQSLRDLSAAGAIRYDVRFVGTGGGWPVRIVLLDERTVREYPDEVGRGARISLGRAGRDSCLRLRRVRRWR
ncbi:MAG: hypothetical protein WKF76_10305 [Nocardioidaceae bacterium]